jgi:hypothetical protein
VREKIVFDEKNHMFDCSTGRCPLCKGREICSVPPFRTPKNIFIVNLNNVIVENQKLQTGSISGRMGVKENVIFLVKPNCFFGSKSSFIFWIQLYITSNLSLFSNVHPSCTGSK